VKLWSRNGIDVTARYAVLSPALQKIEGSCVLDGELCALDKHGRSRFQLMQNALNKKAKLLYVVFDVLFVSNEDIRQRPLLENIEGARADLRPSNTLDEAQTLGSARLRPLMRNSIFSGWRVHRHGRFYCSSRRVRAADCS
jgi:hypothetical protein